MFSILGHNHRRCDGLSRRLILQVGGLSGEDRWLACGGAKGTVCIWDVESGAAMAVIDGHKNTVYGVAFSANGKQLASASFDRTIKVWELA